MIMSCFALAFAVHDLQAVEPKQGSPEHSSTGSGSAQKPAEDHEGQPTQSPPNATFKLPTTIVTSTRMDTTQHDSPMALTIVEEQELLEKAVRTPAEALRHKPGIWVQKTGHLGGAPIIRGFIGNRVLYNFDGVRQNTAALFAGPNSNLQNIDTLDVDRIEVIRGPGSVLYGSDAIGGVVNVTTNEAPRFTDSVTWGGRSYARYGTVDEEKSARQEFFIGSPNISLSFGATYRDIDDLEGGGDVGTQSPSDWREKNYDGQIDLKLSTDHRLQFFLQDFSRPHGARFDRPNWDQENDRHLYGLRYFGRDISFVDKLETTLYYHDQENFIDERFWDSDSDQETLGFDIQASSYLSDSVEFVYGSHYHHDDITKSNPQADTEDPDVEWDNYAAFGLVKWQAADRLRFDAGLRWDRFELESTAPSLNKLDSTLQTAIANGSFARSDLELDTDDDAFTGGFGFTYEVTDDVNWVGHVGRAFRAPNKSDMLSFGAFTQGFGVPAGGGLDPEKSWTYETGLNVSRSNFSGSLTAFYTKLKDAIDSAPGTFNGSTFVDVDGDGMQDPNGERVFIKQNSTEDLDIIGIEMSAQYYLPTDLVRDILGAGELSLFGNATWMDASGALTSSRNNPPLNGLAGIRWEDSRRPSKRRVWIQFEAEMVDRFEDATAVDIANDPAFRSNPQNGSSPLLRSDGDVPGYTVFNLRSGYRVNDQMTVTLNIENLTDKKFRRAFSRIDGPGINFNLGVEAKF